jgi:phospholipase/carboxylesterase
VRSVSLSACIIVLAATAARGQEQLYSAAPDPAPAQPSAAELPDSLPDENGWGVAAGLRYLEIIRGGASRNDKLPLLLVIHGLGDKPSYDWLHAVDVDKNIKVRMILPQAPAPQGDGFSWFPYRAGSLDQAALARSLSAAAERVSRLIEALQKTRPTRGRAVVSGFSQGGMLSWAVALSRPDLVEAAVPISGMLPVPLWPERPHDATWFPKVRALHGRADTVVRFEVDQQLVDRAKELGYPVELAPFDATGHTITAQMSALVRATLNEIFTAAAKKPSAPVRKRPR